MTKAFNRIAITKDEDAQTKFRSQVRLKQRHISDLHQYIKQFVTAPEQNALQGNFYNYTESEEQNKLYKALEKVCIDLKQLHTMGVRLSPATLMQGTSNALVYDWATQQMKPNLRRVLGTERG